MKPIRVLVVDDSAFARKVVREVLTGAGMEVVAIARDGLEALEKIVELEPDVVTLDLVMPNLDGMGVLAALKPDGPRVVVVSMAGEDSALGIAALHAGAVELVHKPTALAVDRLYDLRRDLIDAVRAAAGARLPDVAPISQLPAAFVAPKRSFVAIGASTGGPQALSRLVKALPAEFPLPVAIVLHLPPGYTRSFAERLDSESALEVQEAEQGMEMVRGRVIVARAGIHLKVGGLQDKPVAILDPVPTTTPHRPAVDVLFESAAKVFGAGALGVVLTGMGDDGTQGAAAIHAAGGAVLTEAESSCVVYGMPRAVVEAGFSTASVRIEAMAAEIARHI
jgi:two-component system chemotaxis response regulator CheB